MTSMLDRPAGAGHRPDGLRRRLARFAGRRSVQVAAAGWVAANLVLTGFDHLPLHASALAHPPAPAKVLGTDAMVAEVFALMGVVHLLTRRRSVPDLASRVPDRAAAWRETLLVLGYGVLAMLGGYVLGTALGWHAFGFHLDGMVVRTGQRVTPPEAVCWAAYNLLAYAVVPFAAFRRRYTTRQLGLRSSNRRADTVVVLVVLALESTVQLLVAGSSSILGLPPARRRSARR